MNDGLVPPPPSKGNDTARTANNSRIGQIRSLPDALQNLARAQRLEGEVVRQNQDGSTRIRTSEGNIDIQLRTRQPLQTGQRVEVDIPAGRPPRQVVIRTAPDVNPSDNSIRQGRNDSATTPSAQQRTTSQPVQQQSTPVQNQTQTQTQNNQAQNQVQIQTPATSRPAVQAPPLPAQVQQAITQAQTVSPIQNAALKPDSVVRLLPVTPLETQQIVRQSPQTPNLQPTTIDRLQFQTNLIAQTIRSTQQSQTTNLITRPAIPSQPINIQAGIQNLTINQVPLNPVVTPTQPASQIINQFFQLSQSAPTPSNIAPPSPLSVNLVTPTLSPTIQNSSVTPALLPQNSAISLLPINLTSLVPKTQIVNVLQALQNASLTINNPATTQPTTLAQVIPIDARITSIQPPAVQITPALQTTTQISLPSVTTVNLPSPILSNISAGSIIAQVTGFTPQNLPLVTVQLPGAQLPQNFTLQFQANNLTLGTQLQILPQGNLTAPLQTTQIPLQTPLTGFEILQGSNWPAMEEFYQALLQTNPQAAESFARVIPNPAMIARLGPAALLFIAMIRAGDIASWLGDKNIDLIRASGRQNALSRIMGDSASLSRLVNEPPIGGEWRAFPMPVFWQGEIQKITLFMRKDEQKQHESDHEGEQTRFIFDLNLTRMGDVQLDGLLRGERLDLVLRTQTPLSQAMQTKMRGNYVAALESTRLFGELSFQGDPKSWVHVLERQETLGVDA